MASVGKHIKQLRAVKHMTQEQLAENLFVTRQAVSAWETGKALPDLETLERIAAALDADVTEVIYGAPQSPDLKSVKRRWAVLGGIFVMIFAAMYFILSSYGFIGTWKYGFRYQFWNLNYTVTQEELPDSYHLELDLNNLESNAGRVLYEDDAGCSIIVKYVDQERYQGVYRVVFQATGVCSPDGGQFVSGCYEDQLDKQSYELSLSASMFTTVGDLHCSPSRSYTKSSIVKNKNTFGFFVFPMELYDYGELTIADQLAANDGHVTITVSGLTRLATQRTHHLNLYS